MKYIDAEKLIAEIERRKNENIELAQQHGYASLGVAARIRTGEDEEILSLISLQQEQPKVDLEKEYTEFVVLDPVYSKLVNSIVGKSIARHFYELGLNARKK